MKDNKIDNFFAGCFFGMVIAMYIIAYAKISIGLSEATLTILGVIAGALFWGIIKAISKAVLKAIKTSQNRNNNSIYMTAKKISPNETTGQNLVEVTAIIPDFLKNKMITGLKESFGIEQKDIRIEKFDKENHSKFLYILDEENARLHEKALMGMYRAMTGLDKITHN